MEKSSLRVAAYCRVSTDKEDQRNSLSAQQNFFQTYLESHQEWVAVGIFADEGLSGTSIKRRPQFSRMIQQALAGEIDLILTKEVSRFARNTVDTLQITRRLKEAGVGVVFLSDHIDTRDNDGEFRLTIMASVAQEESRKISERTRWGQTQAMKRGVVFGNSSIYGYRLSKGVLTVHPQQAQVVRAIYHKYLQEDKGAYTIARELTQAKVPPPLRPDGPWSSTMVLRILRNEKYAGDLLQKKYRTTDHLTHRKIPNDGTEEQFFFSNHHSPIVSHEDFSAVQQELKRRNALHRKGQGCVPRHWYSGKIRCALCGASFTCKCTRRPNGKEYRRFVCRGRLSGSGCTAPALPGQTLFAYLGQLLLLLPLNWTTIRRQVLLSPEVALLPGSMAAQKMEERLQNGEAVLDAVFRSLTVSPDSLLIELEEVPLSFRIPLDVSNQSNAAFSTLEATVPATSEPLPPFSTSTTKA
ncbi:recombinase family protein [Flavonifractor sp. An100]|uniref:recombinase family protein n=1 Tax=Flavonifractor sp. An100 TaxID=1965538 RepID=UPI000B36A07B|nr:recombinase family protein [Flavonifractor sp. An100]OUQ79205.1 hypothetical protein B5E43_06640 [Flavonifractor sp. An100]